MGKGKGTVNQWVHRLEAGKIIFELNKVKEEEMIKILRNAGKKLPIPSVIVERRKPDYKK
jgi:large subunit ribosomal protein L16